jgi:hypothetical protein
MKIIAIFFAALWMTIFPIDAASHSIIANWYDVPTNNLVVDWDARYSLALRGTTITSCTDRISGLVATNRNSPSLSSYNGVPVMRFTSQQWLETDPTSVYAHTNFTIAAVVLTIPTTWQNFNDNCWFWKSWHGFGYYSWIPGYGEGITWCWPATLTPASTLTAGGFIMTNRIHSVIMTHSPTDSPKSEWYVDGVLYDGLNSATNYSPTNGVIQIGMAGYLVGTQYVGRILEYDIALDASSVSNVSDEILAPYGLSSSVVASSEISGLVADLKANRATINASSNLVSWPSEVGAATFAPNGSCTMTTIGGDPVIKIPAGGSLASSTTQSLLTNQTIIAALAIGDLKLPASGIVGTNDVAGFDVSALFLSEYGMYWKGADASRHNPFASLSSSASNAINQNTIHAIAMTYGQSNSYVKIINNDTYIHAPHGGIEPEHDATMQWTTNSYATQYAMFFVDGQLMSWKDVAPYITSSASTIKIFGNSFFDTKIKRLQIYNRPLTTNEVATASLSILND